MPYAERLSGGHPIPHQVVSQSGFAVSAPGSIALRKPRRIFLPRGVVSLGPLTALIAVVEPLGSSARLIQWSRRGMRKPREGISYADGHVIHTL